MIHFILKEIFKLQMELSLEVGKNIPSTSAM